MLLLLLLSDALVVSQRVHQFGRALRNTAPRIAGIQGVKIDSQIRQGLVSHVEYRRRCWVVLTTDVALLSGDFWRFCSSGSQGHSGALLVYCRGTERVLEQPGAIRFARRLTFDEQLVIGCFFI